MAAKFDDMRTKSEDQLSEQLHDFQCDGAYGP